MIDSTPEQIPPGPRQQMELTDPDGYTVMVAQLEDE